MICCLGLRAISTGTKHVRVWFNRLEALLTSMAMLHCWIYQLKCRHVCDAICTNQDNGIVSNITYNFPTRLQFLSVCLQVHTCLPKSQWEMSTLVYICVHCHGNSIAICFVQPLLWIQPMACDTCMEVREIMCYSIIGHAIVCWLLLLQILYTKHGWPTIVQASTSTDPTLCFMLRCCNDALEVVT